LNYSIKVGFIGEKFFKVVKKILDAKSKKWYEISTFQPSMQGGPQHTWSDWKNFDLEMRNFDWSEGVLEI